MSGHYFEYIMRYSNVNNGFECYIYKYSHNRVQPQQGTATAGHTLSTCPIPLTNDFGYRMNGLLIHTSSGVVICRSSVSWASSAHVTCPIKLVIASLCPSTKVVLKVTVKRSWHWKRIWIIIDVHWSYQEEKCKRVLSSSLFNST